MLEGRVGFQAVGAGTSKKVSAEMVSVGVKGLLLLTSAGQKKVPSLLSLSGVPQLAPTSIATLTGSQLARKSGKYSFQQASNSIRTKWSGLGAEIQ